MTDQRTAGLAALAYLAAAYPAERDIIEQELAELLPNLTADERWAWSWHDIRAAEERRQTAVRIRAGGEGGDGDQGERVLAACQRAVEWDDHRKVTPRVLTWPTR